jgi:PEP-CTERM motif
VDGINNVGQILAEGITTNGVGELYLLTPTTLPEPAPPQIVPEPSTWVVFAVGLGVVAYGRSRERKKAKA